MRVAQELHIEKGATLLANNDFAAWGNGSVGSAIITAKQRGQTHIAITGGGTVSTTGRRRNVCRRATCSQRRRCVSG